MRVDTSSKSDLSVSSKRPILLTCSHSFTPVGLPTYCYKMGFDGAGKPFFTQVGATEIPSAGRVGVGIPTITSVAQLCSYQSLLTSS